MDKQEETSNFKLEERITAYNSTYKKLAVQWLNEALCFVSSSVLVDSLVLRNRQLLVAAKRYGQAYETLRSLITITDLLWYFADKQVSFVLLQFPFPYAL